MITQRQPDAGFTLIEVMVALAILAMSAIAILGAAQAHVARINALEYRAAALWTVENGLAEVTLGLPLQASPDPMLGITFDLGVLRTATGDPDLWRLDLTAADAADGTVYARLTGFVAFQAERQP